MSFEANAVRASAQANCKRDRLAQVAENPDERRKLALTNFNNASAAEALQEAREIPPGAQRTDALKKLARFDALRTVMG
jgi:hypothetical protein